LTVGDFNGGGKPDVGISVSKEDMRARGVGMANWLTPQVVLLSKADGSYSVDRFSVLANGPRVQPVHNDVGGVDFVYTNHAGGQPAAFRWSSTGWQEVPGYPRVSASMTFWPGSQPGHAASRVVSVSTDPADGTASLQLQEKTGGEWTTVSKYVIPSRRIETIGWNRERIQTTLATLDGIQLTYATFEEACVMRMSPSGRDDVVLARIGGFFVPASWDGVAPLDQTVVGGTAMLKPFTATDALVPAPELFDIAPTGISFTDFQCEDINRDGYTDVVVNTQGAAHIGTLGGTLFYINDKAGSLVKTTVPDLPAMPGIETGWGAGHSVVKDFDGDGAPDLLYYTTLGLGLTNDLCQPFRLYLRKRLVE
jgi:hypothetical protein